MKLVVGLGNSGRRYTDTRHNIGFMVLDRLAASEGSVFDRTGYRARLASAQICRTPVLLAKPRTFMNRSGLAVSEMVESLAPVLQDILIVCDDFNLPFGALRVRPRGRSGGQKGLESVINCLQTAEFPRLRVGIGSPPAGTDAVDYVLEPFSPAQAQQLEEVVERACQAVRVWLAEGIGAAMNRFNSTGG